MEVDRRILCLGVGRHSSAYRLCDLHQKFHYVTVRNYAAAQRVLAALDRKERK